MCGRRCHALATTVLLCYRLSLWLQKEQRRSHDKPSHEHKPGNMHQTSSLLSPDQEIVCVSREPPSGGVAELDGKIRSDARVAVVASQTVDFEV